MRDTIGRYRTAGRTDGGPYSLAELMAELHDRKPCGVFPTIETARLIVAQAGASPDGVTTYGAIWHAFRPTEPWQAHRSRREVTNALERVQHYCVRCHLPLLATLVVNAGARNLTDDAVRNIAGWARENGLPVGMDDRTFVDEQQRLARLIAATALG